VPSGFGATPCLTNAVFSVSVASQRLTQAKAPTFGHKTGPARNAQPSGRRQVTINIPCPTCGSILHLAANATCQINDDAALCDALHEAGHAVVGVVLGFDLVFAASAACKTADPKCKFDHTAFNQMVEKGDPSDTNKIVDGTERSAIMLFAGEYAEAFACDLRSREQQEAIHGDYLDAQLTRTMCRLPYLSFQTVINLKQRAEVEVRRLEPAIRVVAEFLRRGETLDLKQVKDLMASAGVS